MIYDQYRIRREGMSEIRNRQVSSTWRDILCEERGRCISEWKEDKGPERNTASQESCNHGAAA